MLITLRMLYARIIKLLSVSTFFSPFVKNCPYPHHRFSVPDGCSTSCPLSFILSGSPRTRCAILSNASSPGHLLTSRRVVLVVHWLLIPHSSQATPL